MENQHRAIKGYRELNQTEIDLMNDIKSHASLTENLISKIRTHLATQRRELEKNIMTPDVITDERFKELTDERKRIDDAEPLRWLAEGKTDLQKGLMSLTRAVAQPTFF